MSAICIIPARGGSRRIPRKNIREFHGKPIIAYSIENALAICGDVYVSTDDSEIGYVAQEYGAKVIGRPARLARDDVGTFDVVRDAAYNIASPGMMNVLCLYATAPLLSIIALKDSLAILKEDVRTAHVVGIRANPLQDAGAFYWSRSNALLQNANYWEWKTVGYHLKDSQVCDINTEEDWQRAEQMYAKLKEEGKL